MLVPSSSVKDVFKYLAAVEPVLAQMLRPARTSLQAVGLQSHACLSELGTVCCVCVSRQARSLPRSLLFDLWMFRVTRCHSYVVHKKWKYECTFCKRVIRRHSKSIKLEVRLCGIFSMLFLQKGTEATIWLVESCSYKDAVVAAISCGSSAPSSATALQ